MKGRIVLSKKFVFNSNKEKDKVNFFECKKEKNNQNFIFGSHIELFANKEITVEGCMGVSEYREDYMKLKLNKGMLILCGKSFDILFFENELINIKGVISSIEFCI